ncbi:MAG TPA: hypothetical protein VGS22_22525 [Thermoanaerobaculia bacterium]|jgi:ELWxxDGT repeat protein|nr:hypothetical protein [Thermoanaerobaculia bacterium]
MNRFPRQRGFTWRAIFGAGLFAFVGQAAVAAPHLVTDLIRSRVGGSFYAAPSQGIEQEGVLYFPGQDPQHGAELWRSDGTPEGTYRLTDICPGSCSGGGRLLGFFQGSMPPNSPSRSTSSTGSSCGRAMERRSAPAWCATWRGWSSVDL